MHDEGAMACDRYLDGEDYYIVEDDNEGASSEYVPCVKYPNDKACPEDEKNGWVRLDEDTGATNVYRFEGLLLFGSHENGCHFDFCIHFQLCFQLY